MKDLSKYQKQIILPEFGVTGQKKLIKSKVLCVGAGGLGCPALLYLVAAGIGEIGIIDMDHIDISNLQRQILFFENEKGLVKSEVAKKKLKELNPDVKIKSFFKKLQASNALEIMKDYDLVIDGSDNFQAKFLINDAAVKLGIPVIYGSISGFEGYISVFWAKYGPCYRCLYKEPPKQFIPNCAENGVIGPLAGIVGSMQAMEAIKVILCQNNSDSKLNPLIGKMLIIDTMTMNTNSIKLSKNKSCKVCSINSNDIKIIDYADFCDIGNNVKEISYSAIAKLENLNLIDVREGHERNMGYIEGSIHLPLSKLQEEDFVKEITANKYFITHCSAGKRSKIAANILQKQNLNVDYFGGTFEELRKLYSK